MTARQAAAPVLGLGLTLDYSKPAPWLPMAVQYPVGLALVGAAIFLAVLILDRLRPAARFR
jgi:hypothetical protein